MVLDTNLLDALTAQAKASPRLRMNLDLRNTPADQSQRMLNALEPGTVMPIHRHRHTSETVIVLRGKVKWVYYNDNKDLSYRDRSSRNNWHCAGRPSAADGRWYASAIPDS